MISEYTGIEIGRQGLRFSVIEAEKNHARILESGFLDLEDAFTPGILEKKIPDLFSGTGVINGPVVLSISPSFVAFRRVDLPFSSESKIRQVIGPEIEPLIPFQPDRLQTSFIKIPSESDAKSSSILACCMDGDEMDSILAAFKSNGLEVVAVTVSGYASAAFYASSCKSGDGGGRPEFSDLADRGIIYADLGDDCITFSIIKSNEILFTRPVGLRKGAFPDPTWICDETSRTITYYCDYYDPDFMVSELALSSSRSKSRESAGKIWHDELTKAFSLKDISFRAIDEGNPEFNNILSAVSLFASGKGFLNFVESGFFRAGFLKGLRQNWTATVIMAGCTLLIGMIYLGVSEYSNYKTLKRLDSEIKSIFLETFPETKKIVDPYQQMSVKVKSLIQNEGGGAEKESVIDMIREISRRIKPEADITLTSLNVLPDEIQMNGEASSFDLVETARKMLAESEMFREVKVDSVNSDSKTGKVLFKLHLGRG